MESEALEPIISKNQSQADNDNDNLKDKINKLLDEYGYPREVKINLCPPYPQEPIYKTIQLADVFMDFSAGNSHKCIEITELINLYKYLKLCNGNDMNIKSIVSTPDNKHIKGQQKKIKIDGAATKLILDSTYNAIIKYDQECGNLWTKYLLNKDTTKDIELTDDDLDAILDYENEWNKYELKNEIQKIGCILDTLHIFMVVYYGIFNVNNNHNPIEKDLAFLYDLCVIHERLPYMEGASNKEKYDKVKYRMDAYTKAINEDGLGGVPKGCLMANVARIKFLH